MNLWTVVGLRKEGWEEGRRIEGEKDREGEGMSKKDNGL